MERTGPLRLFSVLFLSLGYSQDQRPKQDQDYLSSEMHCPDANAKLMVKQVNWDVPYRAYLTAPPGIRIAPSKLPNNAGLGVISDTFIPKYTWLGESDGDYSRNVRGVYSWVIQKKREVIGLMDSEPISRSSYHRFVNMANLYKDNNVVVLQCYSKIFYMTKKDVAPGTELYIHYGEPYAQHLGIDLNEYFEVPEKWLKIGLDLNEVDHRRFVLNASIPLSDLKFEDPENSRLWETHQHCKV